MKKFVAVVVLFALLAVQGTVLGAEIYLQIGNNLAVSNNNVVAVDPKNGAVEPIELEGRTLVPVRFIAEAFGADVLWNETTSTVTLLTTESMTTIVIGSDVMTVEKGGQVREVMLDVPAMLYEERTLLPLRAVAEEALGYQVYWDEGSRMIGISSDLEYSFSQERIDQMGQRINESLFNLKEFPKIGGSTDISPFFTALTQELLGVSEKSAGEIITCSSAHEAYMKLINKEADLIFVTALGADELALAQEQGVELEVVPFCKDAFVFLVHQDNSIASLTLEQIREIYQGNITNFKEVGGRDMEITAYQRPVNSGIQTLMEELVMQGAPMMEAPKETVMMGMGDLVDAVANYDNSSNSLGYSAYSYTMDMYTNGNIKLLGVNGVLPNYDTIKALEYPLTSNYYAVIRKDEGADSPARKVLEYVISEEGQTFVDQCGLVSM